MIELRPLPNRRRDILLLVFSIISILGLLSRGIYLVVTGFISFNPKLMTDLASNIFAALSMLFCAVLLLPVMVLSVRRLKGHEIHPARIPRVKFWQIVVLIGVWVFTIIFCSIMNSLFRYGWIIAAPFFLLGIAIPIISLVWIAIGGLPTGSWRRPWTALGIGMTVSTSLAILLEYLVVGAALVAAGLIAVVSPELHATIEQLKNQITNAGDAQALLNTLAPYLKNPLVLLVAMVFVAGIGPLIEEALKPLAVWLVGKHLQSPAEGFALGALCGAGFAILEGMLVASGSTELLGFSLAGRATSSLMHITASGLMGWAVASVQLEKRFGRLAWTYLLSVTIHGLWNGAALLAVYGGLSFSLQDKSLDLIGGLAISAGVGILGLMLVTTLVILPIINSHLQPIPTLPAHDDIIVPPIF